MEQHVRDWMTMDREFEPRFSLAELVEATGIPARTVRYYIDRDLVPRAQGKGRYAYYTAVHVEALARVRELRERNLSLEEMRAVLAADEAEEPAAAAGESWTRHVLHPGLEIHIKSGSPDNVVAFARQVQVLASRWFDGTGDDVQESESPPWT